MLVKSSLLGSPNDAFGGIKHALALSPAGSSQTGDTDSDSTLGRNTNPASTANMGSQASGADADMDVADDVDHWR